MSFVKWLLVFFFSHRIIDRYLRILKWNIKRLRPGLLDPRDHKTWIQIVWKYSVGLRTGSNPKEINRFRNHTGKYFNYLVYKISTGKVLPGIVKIGASKKYSENLTASSVADVTISFRSGRFLTAFFRIPNRTSVLMDRSWASSNMIQL